MYMKSISNYLDTNAVHKRFNVIEFFYLKEEKIYRHCRLQSVNDMQYMVKADVNSINGYPLLFILPTTIVAGETNLVRCVHGTFYYDSDIILAANPYNVKYHRDTISRMTDITISFRSVDNKLFRTNFEETIDAITITTVDTTSNTVVEVEDGIQDPILLNPVISNITR